MTIWRLEWLRLLRTYRLLAVLGSYVFFGLSGPLATRYAGAIVAAVDTQGMTVEIPPPTAADGFAQFISNANQLGLLTVLLVAASALAFDARREMAIFLRTRVTSIAAVVLPAYCAVCAAATIGLLLGTSFAWYETEVLLGGLPPARMLVGFAASVLFLLFAVALVALFASLVRSVLAAAGCTIALLAAMLIVRGLTGGQSWLPVVLTGATQDLLQDAAFTRFVPAMAVTAGLTALALFAAALLGGRREV